MTHSVGSITVGALQQQIVKISNIFSGGVQCHADWLRPRIQWQQTAHWGQRLMCTIALFVLFHGLLFTRWRSFAEYWKYFVARFAGSERILMKLGELWVYCLELALTDFGCDPCRSKSWRPCGSFFLSGKQRTTLPISGQPNFTKFAHKTWFWDVVNPFGIIFWKFALKDDMQWFFTKLMQKSFLAAYCNINPSL